MKTKLLTLSIVCAALMVACNNDNPKHEDTTKAAENQNDARMEDHQQKKDADFLVEVADGNMLEVELGKLAEKNGRMHDVKNFGKMMVEHHSKVLSEVKGLAAKKGVTLPESMSDDSRKKVEEMSEKANQAFDNDYIDAMKDDHKKDVKAFEDVTNDDKADADLKAWASTTLPLLHSHLDEITRIKEKFDIEKKK